ncbi:MAG: hypothetical protein Kow0090_19740 [Myxococcota bacterium]
MKKFWGATLLAITLFGCGEEKKFDSDDDDDNGYVGGGDNESFFLPPPETAELLYKRLFPDETVKNYPAKIVGEKKIKGKTFSRFQVGDFSASDLDAVEIWLDTSAGETVTIAGAEIYRPNVGDASSPDITITLKEPVNVSLNISVGEPQTKTVEWEVEFSDSISPIEVALYEVLSQSGVTTEYTLVDDSETVDTPMGSFSGCKHYQYETKDTTPILTGEVWLHSTVGVVKIISNWPPPEGVDAGLLSILDYGTPAEGFNTIQSATAIGATNPNYELNTYYANEQFDADKDTHAKMLLELRWADPEKAKSTTQPPVGYEFGTVMGVYPTFLTMSQISLFYPHENGEGYNYWVAAVDQAAKNESQNGIAYHIRTWYDTTAAGGEGGDVRVTGRINYKLYKP